MVKFNSIAQKASGVTLCLRGFTGLAVVNILTFWVPFFVMFASSTGETPWLDGIMIAGIATVSLAGIYFIYYLFRIIQAYDVWFGYPFFVLLPFTTIVALLLLCRRTYAEAGKTGHRPTIFPPPIGARLACCATLALGLLLVYFQARELWNHARLTKMGVPITGTLQMVTKHYADLIPSGYSFDITYAGKYKSFTVDGALFSENTLPDGRFTHHPVSLIYLPDDPDVAELVGTPGFSIWSPIHFLIGALIAGSGWLGLSQTFARNAQSTPKKLYNANNVLAALLKHFVRWIDFCRRMAGKRESTRTSGGPNDPPQAQQPPQVRIFIVDQQGRTKVDSK